MNIASKISLIVFRLIIKDVKITYLKIIIVYIFWYFSVTHLHHGTWIEVIGKF